MNDLTPKKLAKNEKLKIEDANLSDERIPRNLILMYGDTPYITKPGLEWKANQLFGAAGYNLDIEPVTMDYEKGIFVFKATLTVLKNNARYVNFGEATNKNANSMMQKNLLHLAVTRAECRALRMATACGYASFDEVMTVNGDKPTKDDSTPSEDISKSADSQQISTIKSFLPEKEWESIDSMNLTIGEAAAKIRELTKRKK